MISTNKELASWILRFPEDEMSYYCIAINGCGAIALNTTGNFGDEMKDALKYGIFALES